MIPSTVNVLGTLYRVELVASLPDGDCGHTLVSERLIKISTSYPSEVQVETFYHELMHALMGHLGLDQLIDEKTEEAFAQGLGMAMTSVLSMNELPTLEFS